MTAATFIAEPEEGSRVPCPACAGTGKVRDYSTEPSLFGANTFFTVDPEKLKLGAYDFTAMCGT